MTKHLTAMALAMSVFSSGVASATDLEPGSSQTIRLGAYSGTVFYTAKRTGFHVVATIARDGSGEPVNFASEMKPGDRMLISVPRERGRKPVSLVIHREGDRLVLTGVTPDEAGEKLASSAE